jgi:hypothetical protein
MAVIRRRLVAAFCYHPGGAGVTLLATSSQKLPVCTRPPRCLPLFTQPRRGVFSEVHQERFKLAHLRDALPLVGLVGWFL